MVRVENNKKLIIEIETLDPIGELAGLQNALIDAVKNFNSEGSDGMTVFRLMDFLSATMPTFDQNRVLYLE